MLLNIIDNLILVYSVTITHKTIIRLICLRKFIVIVTFHREVGGRVSKRHAALHGGGNWNNGITMCNVICISAILSPATSTEAYFTPGRLPTPHLPSAGLRPVTRPRADTSEKTIRRRRPRQITSPRWIGSGFFHRTSRLNGCLSRNLSSSGGSSGSLTLPRIPRPPMTSSAARLINRVVLVIRGFKKKG